MVNQDFSRMSDSEFLVWLRQNQPPLSLHSTECPDCGHPGSSHLGQWCRVPTGAVNRAGKKLICCCESVSAADPSNGVSE